MITIDRKNFDTEEALNEVLYGSAQIYGYESIDYGTQIYPTLVNYYLEKQKGHSFHFLPDLYEDVGEDDFTKAFNYIENVLLTILGPCITNAKITLQEKRYFPQRMVELCKNKEDFAGVLSTYVNRHNLREKSSFINTLLFIYNNIGKPMCIQGINDKNKIIFEKEFKSSFTKVKDIATGALAEGLKNYLNNLQFQFEEQKEAINIPKHIKIVFPKENANQFSRPVILVENLTFNDGNSRDLFLKLIKTSCSLVDAVVFNKCVFNYQMFDDDDEVVRAQLVFNDCKINSINVGKHILQKWIFKHCHMTGLISFASTHFENGIEFEDCIFEGSLNLDCASFGTKRCGGTELDCFEVNNGKNMLKIHNTMFLGKDNHLLLSNIDFNIPTIISAVSFGSKMSFAFSKLTTKHFNFSNITFRSTNDKEYLQARQDFYTMLKNAGVAGADVYKIILAEKEPTATGDVILTPKEAANCLGVSIGTLARWRATRGKEFLQFYKKGKQVYYMESDVEAFKRIGHK